MRTKISDEYISNRAWLRDIVAGQSLILRGTSALEYLELIDGYLGENEIYVYARHQGQFENINYAIVDNFEHIEYVQFGNVLCSTFNQVVNDMLSDLQSDDQVLCEALCNYFHSNNKSFDGLRIETENVARFNLLKSSAIAYYNN